MNWSVPKVIFLALAIGFAVHAGGTLAGYVLKPTSHYLIVCVDGAETYTCRTLQELRDMGEQT